MKKEISILCLMLLAAAGPATGLELLVGPRFSLGHTFDCGSDYADYLEANDAYRQLDIRHSLGAFAELRLSPLLALQPELMFTKSGYEDYGEWPTMENRSSQKYLEALLLAKLIVPGGRTSLQLFAGPDLRVGVGTWEYDVDDVTINEYDREARKAAGIRNTYLGVVAGVGLRRQGRYNCFQIDARGYLGLQSVDRDNAVRRMPAALWVTLGYGFSLEKRDPALEPPEPVRFKQIAEQDRFVNRSEGIPANPFFSAYLDSEYHRRRLFAHVLYMDARLNLPRDTSFDLTGMEVVIVEPVEIRSRYKHPASGVWRHRFQVTREGKTRTYTLWFLARDRKEPRYIPGIMGTTRSNVELQYDLAPVVTAAAHARLRNPANRAHEPFISDSRVLGEGGEDGKDAWREEWSVRIGSETIVVEIEFSAGPWGIVNYKLAAD
jgi:hypothetical protein